MPCTGLLFRWRFVATGEGYVRGKKDREVVSEEWIANLNTEFRAKGVEQRRRPWEAIRRYSEEFNASVDLSSDIAKTIFKWFEVHSKPGVHQIGSLYEAVYFFDSQFWVVSIPITYGTVQLNALDSLREMPESIKQEMMADHKQAWDYASIGPIA